MNPLVKTCLNMARKAHSAGSGDALFSGPYREPTLVKLANWMLIQKGSTVRLAQEPERKALGEAGSIVLFSGGIYSYITLLYELYMGRKVTVLHFDRSPARDLAFHLEWAWTEAQALEIAPSEPLVADMRAAFRKSPSASLDVHVLDWAANTHTALDPLLMVAVAAEEAADQGCSKIVLGTTLYTHELRFARETSRIFTEAYKSRIRIDSPLQGDSPEQAICRFLDFGFSKETLIQDAYSCDTSTSLQPQCGVCWGCYRRWRTFTELGWLEKHFDVLPPDGKDFERYSQRWDKLLA